MISDSSSEGSIDEDEILKNFDEEAKIIAQKDMLPTKSADRYRLVYNNYKKWKEDNKNLLSKSEENNLLVYFKKLQGNLKPTTLWSIWSMLCKTLGTMDNINITQFLSLKSYIKNNAKGYKPRKTYVFRWHHIVKFINEAIDNIYLAMKVVLIFGICGCLRCDEITNLKVDDVENLGNKFLVSIEKNKNDYAGQFIIGNLFYEKVKNYMSLRPSNVEINRFFIKYNEGKCYRQPIGVHKIGEIPSKIATYLQLPNAHRYTGHCLRRTSATLLSDSGATMQQIKQLGRWRSDLIAQGYIENSLHNRQLIFNGVVQNTEKLDTFLKPSTNAHIITNNTNPRQSTGASESFNANSNSNSKPSTSAQESFNANDTSNSSPSISAQESLNAINECGENGSNYQLDWSDFAEDFNSDTLNPSDVVQNNSSKFNSNDVNLNPSGFVQNNFVTARDKPILMPAANQNKQNILSSKLFFNKPALKLDFENQTVNQKPTLKKRKIQENLDDQNNTDTSSMLEKHGSSFDNCTFNNCVFNFNRCDCSKENNL